MAHDLRAAFRSHVPRPLHALDRVDPAPDDLGIKRAGVERQHQRRCDLGRDIDAANDRQRVIEPDDLCGERRVAKDLDVGDRRRRD